MLKRLYELFIGFRYLKAKKSQGFISFNTFLSVFIVFIGVFILVLVISVMNGFQSQIKDKIIDVEAHITVTKDFASIDPQGFSTYPEICKKLGEIRGVTSVLPYFQGHGLFKGGGEISPIIIRGMGSVESFPAQFSRFITEGEKGFPKNGEILSAAEIKKREPERGFSKPGEIFLGSEMKENYNLEVGDYVQLIVPRGKLGSDSLEPGTGRYRVAGFFKTGYYEFDTRLVIISLSDAQRLFAANGKATAIGVNIDDIYKTEKYARTIRELLGFSYSAASAEDRNQNLFYALKLEKLIMTVILFLIIVSAGFTIMGTLVMVVMEKRRAIGILKSMGATPRSIMAIFVLEGFLIGLVGSLSGVVSGLAAALNLEAIIHFVERIVNGVGSYLYHLMGNDFWTDISLVPSQVYYIEGIPTQITPEFVAFIASMAVFLSTIAAIFPAWYASRLNPIETIRYE